MEPVKTDIFFKSYLERFSLAFEIENSSFHHADKHPQTCRLGVLGVPKHLPI